MVQYESPQAWPGRLSSNADYWKVQNKQFVGPELFAFDSKASLLRSQYLHGRSERNLISYEGRTYRELYSFCLQRRLLNKGQESPVAPASDSSKPSKQELIRLLEYTDDYNTAFHKMLDLPPEIRLLIYFFYFQHLRFGGKPRPPPPLLETCALIRNEALKPFYQTSYLIIAFKTEHPKRLTLEPHIKEFIDKAPIPAIAELKKFQVHLYRSQPIDVLHWWFEVGINGNDGRMRLERQYKEEPMHGFRRQLQDRVGRWFDAICRRDEQIAFRRSDFYELMQLLDVA